MLFFEMLVGDDVFGYVRMVLNGLKIGVTQSVFVSRSLDDGQTFIGLNHRRFSILDVFFDQIDIAVDRC